MFRSKIKSLFIASAIFLTACQLTVHDADNHPVVITSASAFALDTEVVNPPNADEVDSILNNKNKTSSMFRNKTKTNIRVGVLAPFSGDNKSLGLAVKNTATMALYETPSDNVTLQFYDTKGTVSGAVAAIKEAIEQGVDIVVGPVFSYEVKAIADIARSANVDVLALTSDPNVLEQGIYTLALLLPQQVDRIISFACAQGKSNFAVIAPDSESGRMMANAAIASAYKCENAQVSKIAFFSNEQGNMVNIVKEIVGERTEYVDALRRQSKKEGEYAENYKKPEPIEGEEEKIDILEKYTSSEEIPLDFDAILIAEEGSNLRSIAATLNYYDVTSNEAQFLGTQAWANSSIAKESSLLGGWYVAILNDGFRDFSKRYKKIYGANPPRIVSQVYDGVSLAATLANRRNFSAAAITDPSGFAGVDGIFRIFYDGSSERGMAVIQIERNKTSVIDQAPVTFANFPIVEEIIVPEEENKKDFTINIFTEESIEEDHTDEIFSD